MLPQHIEKARRFDQPWITFSRVSNRSQDHIGHHARAQRFMAEYLRGKGVTTIVPVNEVASGFADLHKRHKLIEAMQIGRDEKSNVFALSCSRLMRPRGYRTRDKFELQASEGEWEWFKSVSHGVNVYTWCPPEANEHDVSSELTRIYVQERGKEVKCPLYFMGRDKKTLDDAWWWYQDGKTGGQIAKELKLARSTVYDWISAWEDAQNKYHY